MKVIVAESACSVGKSALYLVAARMDVDLGVGLPTHMLAETVWKSIWRNRPCVMIQGA